MEGYQPSKIEKEAKRDEEARRVTAVKIGRAWRSFLKEGEYKSDINYSLSYYEGTGEMRNAPHHISLKDFDKLANIFEKEYVDKLKKDNDKYALKEFMRSVRKSVKSRMLERAESVEEYDRIAKELD